MPPHSGDADHQGVGHRAAAWRSQRGWAGRGRRGKPAGTPRPPRDRNGRRRSGCSSCTASIRRARRADRPGWWSSRRRHPPPRRSGPRSGCARRPAHRETRCRPAARGASGRCGARSGDSARDGARIRSPSAVCALMCSNSSGVSGPGLLRMSSRVPILPMSCSSPPRRICSSRVAGVAELNRGLHGVAAHPARVTAGVGVLGLQGVHQHLHAVDERLLVEPVQLPDPTLQVLLVEPVLQDAGRASPAPCPPGRGPPRSCTGFEM